MQRLVRVVSSGPVRFLVLLALLMAPWPGLGPAYCGFVGKIAAGFLDSTDAGAVRLRFTPAVEATPPGKPWELRVHAEDPVSGRYVGTALDLRRAGYIETAVFAALALAGRVRWRRRVALLFGGLALLQLLPLLPILSFFSGKLPVQAFHFSGVTEALIDTGYHALVAPPGMAFALPALLWLALVWWLDRPALSWLGAAIGRAVSPPGRTLSRSPRA